MKFTDRMNRAFLNISFLALDISLLVHLGFPETPVHLGSRLASIATATESVENTTAPLLSSVSFEDSSTFTIVRQPPGESNYVSKNNGEVTQFSAASQYGNIGLLAHNYLSGKSFSQLTLGQEIGLIYGDGTIEYFVVSGILRYQALQPKSPFSSFQNLNNKNEVLSAQQMFERAYAGDRHITFQTCIAADGISSWGRLFVIAIPRPDRPGLFSQNRQNQP